VAGEYFVAAELSLRGCLASITLRNSRGIDIIASNADASKSVSVHAEWLAGKKVDGSARKDSSIRKFADHQGKYRECWGLLGL
jgi:hypothetical protein